MIWGGRKKGGVRVNREKKKGCISRTTQRVERGGKGSEIFGPNIEKETIPHQTCPNSLEKIRQGEKLIRRGLKK